MILFLVMHIKNIFIHVDWGIVENTLNHEIRTQNVDLRKYLIYVKNVGIVAMTVRPDIYYVNNASGHTIKHKYISLSTSYVSFNEEIQNNASMNNASALRH